MNSKEGKKHFYSACHALCNKSFECDAENLHDFLTLLKTRGYDNEWVNTIFMVPRNKDDLNSERISIIDKHGELSIKAICAFEMSYIATLERQAQDTLMLFKCLMASLLCEGCRRVNMDKSMYIIKINGHDYTVENRNVSIDKKIILEDTNMNKNETNAICTKTKDTQKVSKQVNEQNTPYRDALIRLNFS
jgi:hypothetical protein